MAFNMYHVLNPEAIKTGSRPNLTEIGPFVYREYREKRDIEQSPDGCSVKAAQWKKYEFDQEKTTELCGEPCKDGKETMVTVINAAYVGVLQLIRDGYSKC